MTKSPVSNHRLPPALLVVGHPGHELRVYGWMAQNRPDVVVLTDGSGHTEHARTESSRRLVSEVGASATQLFGKLRDADVYSALRDHRFEILDAIVMGVTALVTSGRYAVVAGDALEGYNPTHDLCRVIIDEAVEAARTRGIRIRNLEFTLVGAPAGPSDERIALDDKAFQAKLKAARAYTEMRQEVKSAFARFGPEAFRYEALMPSRRSYKLASPPYYEQYGERQQQAGIYAEVIRYKRHFLPAVEYIRAKVCACQLMPLKSFSRTAS